MKRRINLVPLSERTRTATDFSLLAMLVAGIVVVFALGFGYYLLNTQLDDKQRELADLEQEVARVQTQVDALRPYEVIKSETDQVEALVKGVYTARTPISDILNDISLVVPDTIWFQSLTLTAPDPVAADAAAAAKTAATQTQINIVATTYTFEDVAQLLIRLRLMPTLRNVALVSANGIDNQALDQPLKTFTIQATVVNAQPETELPVSQVQLDSGAGTEPGADSSAPGEETPSSAPDMSSPSSDQAGVQ